MSKYISWRELQRATVKEVEEWHKAGPIYLTVDGDTKFRLLPLGPENDSQARLASRAKQTNQAAASIPVDSQPAVASGEKALEIPLASVPIDSQSKPPEPIKPGSLQMYRAGYHKAGDRVLTWKNRKLVEAVVPELDTEGQTIPGGWRQD